MARERTRMRKSREILRHILDLDASYEVTEKSVGVSHCQVCRTVAKIREPGLLWADLEPLSDDELEALLYGKKQPLPASAPRPDWPTVDAELRRPGVTLQLLHQEYKAQHPDGLGYSQFCDHYSRFRKRRRAGTAEQHQATIHFIAPHSGITSASVRRTPPCRGAPSPTPQPIRISVRVLFPLEETSPRALWCRP